MRIRTGWSAAMIVRAREIERRLYQQTWDSADHDLTDELRRLHGPTLVIHGEETSFPSRSPNRSPALFRARNLWCCPNAVTSRTWTNPNESTSSSQHSSAVDVR